MNKIRYFLAIPLMAVGVVLVLIYGLMRALLPLIAYGSGYVLGGREGAREKAGHVGRLLR